MLAYSDTSYFFANIKIEQSDAGSYMEDKAKVIHELKLNDVRVKVTDAGCSHGENY